jgi:hypothetical protein
MAKSPNRIEVEIAPKVDTRALEEKVARINKDIDESIAKLEIAKREAHEMVKAAREAIRDMKQAKADFLGTKEVEEMLNELTHSEMGRYTATISEAIERGTQSAYSRFDAIIAICLGIDSVSKKEAQTPLLELLREFIRTKGLPWKLVGEDSLEMPEAFRAQGVRILADDTMKLGTAAIIFRSPTDGKITAKDIAVRADALFSMLPKDPKG